MATEHLHTHPKWPRGQGLDVWWYEDERGFDFYVDVRDKQGERVQTVNFRIPWNRLRSAVGRMDKPRCVPTAPHQEEGTG